MPKGPRRKGKPKLAQDGTLGRDVYILMSDNNPTCIGPVTDERRLPAGTRYWCRERDREWRDTR
jgi:hypothetical protein